MQAVSTDSTFKNFINNEWRESSSQKTIGSTNPSNKEEVVGFVQDSTKGDLDQAVQAAEDAKVAWRKAGKVKRAEYLYKAADILESRIDEIGETMAREMGKTLPESKGETARGVAILRYYAGEGMRKDGDVIPSTDSGALMFTKRVPVGVVGVITPWNFPVAIPIWKMAPALIYGNTIAFKPATEAAVTAAKVIECFAEAGIPEGVINFVTGSGSVVGQALIDHPKVQALTFTGSGNVGEGVAKSAAARGVKFQLEMGGKNPVIVTKDADLDLTIQEVISGAFRSTGQKCTATSRVIVEEAIYDQFVEQLVEETKKIKVGNAVEDGVWMGPSAHEQQFNTVKEYLEIGKKEGATVLAGGDVLTGKDYDNGFFVSPTIFGDVDPTMRIAKEEIFGPVIALFKASDLEDAIQQANDTEFGLSASIFTKDISSILEFIDEIEVGLVRINAESAGVELQAPFGGMKSTSTGGREQGQAAKEFYTETKTVFVKG